MLLKKRGGYVSAVTRVENQLKELSEEEIVSKQFLLSDLKLIRSIKVKFTKLQGQIIKKQETEEKGREETLYMNNFLTRCDEIISKISALVEDVSIYDSEDEGDEDKNDSPPAPTQTQSQMCQFMSDLLQQNQRYMTQLLSTFNNNANKNNSTESNPPSVVKLPHINLPTFDGKFSEWISFRDKFQSSVINHPSLTQVQKLDYLQSALKSEAAAAIQNLSITDANFQVAWDILREQYERKNEIISDHIRTFYQMPKVTPSDTQAIRKIKSTLNACVMALDAMEATSRDPWIIQFVLDRLDSESRSSAIVAVSSKANIRSEHRVYLATAMVDILNKDNERIPCRLLLDGGAQVCVISTELAQKLKLTKHSTDLSVIGVGGHHTRIRHQVTATICSQVSHDTFTVNCHVMPRITGNLPGWITDKSALNIPSNVELADPYWADPKPVDILVCGDVYWSAFLNDVISLGPGLPHLRETVFGYVIVGEHRAIPSQSVHVNHISLAPSIEDALVKFWEIEDISEQPPLTDEQREAENHFRSTHSRTLEGRFIVRFPFKKSPDLLGYSRPQAVRQFMSLERQFKKNPTFKSMYVNVMKDQIERGWLIPISTEELRAPSYYMPHHGVYKEESSTTKLRVVYNASAKSSSGYSLNDLLMIGPTIQNDLATILLRFRLHPVALTADISKMYLQLVMNEEDSHYQRLIWRDDDSKPMGDFRIGRVSFGVASSPFLATRALEQLAKEHESEFPRAFSALRESFYVDDCILSCTSLTEAIETKTQLIEVLDKGGFTLAKWSSNYPELYTETNVALTQNTKSNDFFVGALGLTWNPTTDSFHFESPLGSPDEVKTKRNMASAIAKLFDPIGLIGPVIIEAKVMLQNLHKLKKGWDDPIDDEFKSEWRKFVQGMLELCHFQIPRWISVYQFPKRSELHAFCDASMKAYGVAVYVVTVDDRGVRYSSLLLSKSRVAPLKSITIPKLELCGATLAADTVRKFSDVVNPDSIHFWSDSTIVLSWLRSPPDAFKVFVSHRVKIINQSSQPQQWQHVPTACNPADLISRGVIPSKLKDNELWWKGPEWLVESKDSWPKPFDTPLDTSDEVECCVITTMEECENLVSYLLNKYSSLNKIQRIVAYCLRFLTPPSNPQNRGLIATVEMERALITLIRIDQQFHWAPLFRHLQGKSPACRKWKSILALAPFIDDDNVIRVGGRLTKSDEAYHAKHPILLPKSQLTFLLAQREHIKNLHAPPTLLLSTMRQQYWPVSGRNLVRKIVHQCHRCYRLRPLPLDQIMADLPRHRVQFHRPFHAVGVDFAGPIQMLCAATRGVRSRRMGTQKAYVAVYVCMATKAVHLEVVTSLSTEAFISSFRRFAARRTTPRHIYSDCGTNFQGAAKELQRLLQQEESQHEISSATQNHGCIWHFNPPASPHHGGLWEACVKSMKFHLIRVTNYKPLSYEELQTVLTQIEAVLNSRPICITTDDPNDNTFLTPGHFLHFAPTNAPPNPDLSHIGVNRQSYWQ
ncbi:uncharacterized protein LOC129809150, partial [Phlebotomus papatasi]|uniref:uncharacterized protein LOC129809150 n=1 Tax=Phlebotomus papatasi TaxID=29031 RepID=UPI0024846345